MNSNYVSDESQQYSQQFGQKFGQQFGQQFGQKFGQQFGQQFGRNVRESDPRIGFSFNRTLQSIDSNTDINNRAITRTIGQEFPYNQRSGQEFPYNQRSNSNAFSFSGNETQMSSLSRTVFQSPINTNVNKDNSRVESFSFNRALQQVSADQNPNFRSTSRSTVEDIDMDSTSAPRIRHNSLSGEQQLNNSLNYFSHQTNANNLFSSQSTNFQRLETDIPNLSSSVKIYSKESDLTQNDLKQYESQVFTFKNIPIRAPTQQLCF